MKSLDQALTPKKSHAEFPSHKNFSLLYSQNYAARRMQELSQILVLEAAIIRDVFVWPLIW